MKMQKHLTKLIAALIAVTLLGTSALAFSSCGNSTDSDNKKSSGSNSTKSSTESETELQSLGDFNTTPTIKKTVVVDNDMAKISATKLSYSSYAAIVTLEIKNKTNKKLQVTSGTAAYSANSINGYMISEYLNCDVPKKGKSTEEMKFEFTELNIYGITEIADIELAFTISDDDSGNTYTDPVDIKTSIYDDYDYSVNTFKKAVDSSAIQDGFDVSIKYSKDDVIFDKKNISIISEVFGSNKDGTAMLLLEFVNDSSNQLDFVINDLVVDGKTIQEDYVSTKTINSKKHAVMYATMTEEDLKENKLKADDIKKLSFTFTVNDKNYNTLIEDEKIVITL